MRLRNPSHDDAYRRALSDWVQANGLDPADIPIDSPVLIEDGKLTVHRITQDASPHGQSMETVTVPIVVPLPETLR